MSQGSEPTHMKEISSLTIKTIPTNTATAVFVGYYYDKQVSVNT